jgi:hypothetical protein
MKIKSILLSLSVIPVAIGTITTPFIINSCSKEYTLDVNQITNVLTDSEGYLFSYKKSDARSEFRSNPSMEGCAPHIQINNDRYAVYYTQNGVSVQYIPNGDVHESYKLKN